MRQERAGLNRCPLDPFRTRFYPLSPSLQNNSLLNRPGCCCFLRLELWVCVLFGRFSGVFFRREHPRQSGRCCAVPGLTWEAEEGGPDEGAAAGEGGPHVQRHQGEVQELHERPEHQPSLIRVQEFFPPVLQDVLFAFQKADPRVEDAGGQRRRRRLVQEQLLHHHPGGVPRKPALQKTHPEEIEVPVKAEGDHGDVARLSPVHLVPGGEPLVDQVPAGEQAAVQRDVRDPREAADAPQNRPQHHSVSVSASVKESERRCSCWELLAKSWCYIVAPSSSEGLGITKMF